VIGGVTIPDFDLGTEAHSDGDVLYHRCEVLGKASNIARRESMARSCKVLFTNKMMLARRSRMYGFDDACFHNNY